jgi:hypothetical protein
MISETCRYFSDHKELSNTSEFKYFFMAVTYAAYYRQKVSQASDNQGGLLD